VTSDFSSAVGIMFFFHFDSNIGPLFETCIMCYAFCMFVVLYGLQ